MFISMEFLTQQILEAAIRAQDTPTFDSHAIIRYLYTNHQHKYLAELNRNQGARYPFTETHRQIGLALSRLTTLVQREARVDSANIRLADTPNQLWRRV